MLVVSTSRYITDINRADKKLRHGEDFYRQLVEKSPDAMWVHSQDIIVYVNRACVAFFGASSADELLGKHPLDFVHPDDREIVKQKIHEIYYERKPVLQDQARWIRLDGAAVYAEIVARPIEYQGEAGAQVSFRDVSERIQIEENLRKSEASLAAAQRIAHLGSWEIDVTNLDDLDKCSSRWSDEFFRILGYEPGQIESSRRNLLQSIHPDDRESNRNALVSAIHEKKSFSAEYRIIRPNGSERIVRTQGEFVYDENTHKMSKLIGTIQDITAQKKADEKFRALLEAAPDAMIVTNQEGKIVLVNTQTEKVFGYKREELLNNTIEILMPEHFRGRHHDDRTGFSADPQVRPMDEGLKLFGLRKDGSEFRVEISLSPLETEEGVLVTSAIRDITGQVRAEQELIQLSGLLLHSQDNERRRIARELHDSTGQNLVALVATLNQLQGSIPSSNLKSQNLLSECQALAVQCIREVRTLSYSLHPPLLDETGLQDAIRHYMDGFTKRSGIHVELEVSSRFGRLPRDVELALFRVVQEALTNIQRHSGSLHAKIRLGYNADEITLEVSDNGRKTSDRELKQDKWFPFDVGVGIPSMSERVKLIGGHMDIISGSRGTTLRVTAPAGEERDEETSHPDR
jgi:PAS domain S-box-containing protein